MLNFLSQIDALPMKNVQTYLLEASVPATNQKIQSTWFISIIGYYWEQNSHLK